MAGFRSMDMNEAEAALAGPIRALNRKLCEEYLKGLTNPSPLVRRKSARGLGSLGAAAREAIPALEVLLGDRDRRVREAAAAALRVLDPQGSPRR